MEGDYLSQSFSMSSAVLKDGNILENGRASCSNSDHGDLTCIIENMENELHLMSEASLTEYIKSLVDKEVKRLFKCPQEDTLNKVSLFKVLILCFLFELCFVEESLSIL